MTQLSLANESIKLIVSIMKSSDSVTLIKKLTAKIDKMTNDLVKVGTLYV